MKFNNKTVFVADGTGGDVPGFAADVRDIDALDTAMAATARSILDAGKGATRPRPAAGSRPDSTDPHCAKTNKKSVELRRARR